MSDGEAEAGLAELVLVDIGRGELPTEYEVIRFPGLGGVAGVVVTEPKPGCPPPETARDISAALLVEDCTPLLPTGALDADGPKRRRCRHGSGGDS